MVGPGRQGEVNHLVKSTGGRVLETGGGDDDTNLKRAAKGGNQSYSKTGEW